MKKSLISLALVVLALPLGCKVESDSGSNPLASRVGFCKAWAENACQTAVVEDCNATSADACQSTQSDFCLGIVPENYSSKHAKDCLSAVKAAYKDGDLSADELGIVMRLEAPCDQLSTGTASDGEACEKNDDCNTAAGFSCIIKLGAAEGSCGKPEQVGPGEACDGPTQVCEDGYFCNGENCVVYKKTGSGSCEGDYECSPEDHCVIEADADSGTCQVRADLNADCTSDEDCASHYCAVAVGADSGKCANKIRLSLNEPLCDNLR